MMTILSAERLYGIMGGDKADYDFGTYWKNCKKGM